MKIEWNTCFLQRHIFKEEDDEMDSFFFLCGCLMDSPYNHMLFQQICVDIIGGGGVHLVSYIGEVGWNFNAIKDLF